MLSGSLRAQNGVEITRLGIRENLRLWRVMFAEENTEWEWDGEIEVHSDTFFVVVF